MEDNNMKSFAIYVYIAKEIISRDGLTHRQKDKIRTKLEEWKNRMLQQNLVEIYLPGAAAADPLVAVLKTSDGRHRLSLKSTTDIIIVHRLFVVSDDDDLPTSMSVGDIAKGIENVTIEEDTAAEEQVLSHDASVRVKEPKSAAVHDFFLQGPSEPGIFAIMIETEFPGYVHLQITPKGRKLLQDQAKTNPNTFNLIEYLKENESIPNSMFQLLSCSLQAPVVKTENCVVDTIDVLWCPKWPECAKQWVTRERRWWPSQDIVNKVTQGGCYVVPAGNPQSEKKDVQWRISFTRAELAIFETLPEDASSAFSAVKVLLQECMPSVMVLTSCHLQHVLFWMYEESAGEAWGLDQWIEQLLRYTIEALSKRTINNYFIPNDNMLANYSPQEIHTTKENTASLEKHPFGFLKVIIDKAFQGIKVRHEEQQYLEGDNLAAHDIYKVLHVILRDEAIQSVGKSIEPFEQLVLLNANVPVGSRSEGLWKTSRDLCTLLWPLASSCTEKGEVDRAIWLYKAMLDKDHTRSVAQHPDILTNMACAYNIKAQNSTTQDEKTINDQLALQYFHDALQLNADSPGVHFTYGSFLLDSGDMQQAEQELTKATAMPTTGSDSHVFLSIQKSSNRREKTAVPIQIAAHFFLIRCLIACGELERAKQMAVEMEQKCEDVEGSDQVSSLLLCAHANDFLNQPERARELYELHEALESGPSSVLSMNGAGN